MLLTGGALSVLRGMESESVHCCVTSPPYWGLRDYGTAQWSGGLPGCDHVYNHGVQGKGGQRAARTFTAQAVYRRECGKCGAERVDLGIGLERTPEEYTARIVEVFREVRRVLRSDGTLWLNLGDSYARDPQKGDNAGWGKHSGIPDFLPGHNRERGGLAAKNLVGIPWRIAFALQADGWWLRSDIIWHKPNPMPESIRDRPTKSHEYLFLLAKSERYYYDSDAVKEPCSPNTHARYARGRGSDGRKWKDGGPGGQTIARTYEHMRGSGNLQRKYGDGFEGRLNNHLGRNVPWTPKFAGEAEFGLPGEPDPKLKVPSGWKTGPGRHDGIEGRYAPGVGPKAALNAKGSRQNASFSAAVADIVPFRNRRSVWTIATKPYKGAHFATFPPALVEPCILAGCPVGGTVLDPFAGVATVGLVAAQHGREFIGIELNPEYVRLAEERLQQAKEGVCR